MSSKYSNSNSTEALYTLIFFVIVVLITVAIVTTSVKGMYSWYLDQQPEHKFEHKMDELYLSQAYGTRGFWLRRYLEELKAISPSLYNEYFDDVNKCQKKSYHELFIESEKFEDPYRAPKGAYR